MAFDRLIADGIDCGRCRLGSARRRWRGSANASIALKEWQEMLDGKGKCIFGLFDSDKIIGLAAVFTSQEDSNGQSGVLAMDYIDPPIEAAVCPSSCIRPALIGAEASALQASRHFSSGGQ